VDDVDQLSKIFVQDARQGFNARGAPLCQMLGEKSKTRNVREQHRRLHLLHDRLLNGRWISSNSILDESGNIAGKQFCQRRIRHSYSTPFSCINY
jgi:hypothetical protein